MVHKNYRGCLLSLFILTIIYQIIFFITYPLAFKVSHVYEFIIFLYCCINCIFWKYFICVSPWLTSNQYPQETHSDILVLGGGGGGGGLEVSEIFCILYPKKSQLQNLSTKKSPNIFNIQYPKKSHTSSKLCLCYCLFELMKRSMPKKIPVLFSQPKKCPRLSQTLLAKISGPKKIPRAPSPC